METAEQNNTNGKPIGKIQDSQNFNTKAKYKFKPIIILLHTKLINAVLITNKITSTLYEAQMKQEKIPKSIL